MKRLTATPEELAEHARDLARAFKIPLQESSLLRYEDGVSLHDPNPRHDHHLVIVSPVRDEVSYAIALHELGHCIAPCGVHMQQKLTQEYAAWDWAEYHALIWTPAMEHTRILAVQTYIDSAARVEAQKRQNEIEDAKRSQSVKKFIKGLKL